MSRFIALFLVVILTVVVMGQLSDSMNFEYIKRQLHMDKISKVICGMKPDYGKCKGKRQLWYYNKYRNKCETFIYSNCGGNRNHFFTKNDCDKFCTEKSRRWNLAAPLRPGR